MSLAALRRALERVPGETLVPVSWVLRELDDAEPSRPGDLTVSEVAEELGRAASTVRGWIASGALDSYKFRGREHRVTRAALDAFLERERNGDRRERADTDGLDLGAWRQELEEGAA